MEPRLLDPDMDVRDFPTIRIALSIVLLATISLTQPACAGDQLETALEHARNGDRFASENRQAEAIIEYRNAVRLAPIASDPDSAQAHRALATFYIGTGRADVAEPHVKAAAEVIGTLEARFALADYYVLTGRPSMALSTLTTSASLTASEATSVKLKTARIHQASGKPDEASRIVDEILTADARNSSALAFKARLQLDAGHRTEALATAREATLIGPSSAQAFFALGVVARTIGLTDDARRAFGEVLRIDPRATAAQVELAQVHLSEREVETALTFAEAAVRSSNGEIEPHLVLARVLTARPEDHARLELAQIADSELPGNADVKDTLGWVHYKRRAYVAAIRTLQDAVLLAPRNPMIHYHLGLAHARNAEDARARGALETALKLNPVFPKAADARRVLRTLLY